MLKLIVSMFSLSLACGLTSCATSANALPGCPDEIASGDYCAYDKRRDASIDVKVAQTIARDERRKTIIVMGANWCHDSRALAGHFNKPRFEQLIAGHYQLVYVDVGKKNRNIDLAKSFGLDGIVGTPTVIITDSDGTVLNLDTAPTWRNAASRSEDDIFNYYADFAAEN